jgi:hypothetical protein
MCRGRRRTVPFKTTLFRGFFLEEKEMNVGITKK